MTLELTVSWSEIDAARQCLKKHQLAFIERWQEPTMSPALQRGITWHRVMEWWYEGLRKGLDPTDIVKAVGLSIGGDPERDLFLWMLDGYVRKWGLDAGWAIKGVELGDVIPMPRPDGVAPLVDWAGREVPLSLKLKVDLLVEAAGFNGAKRLFVVDHKSGGSLPGDRAMEFEDQFGLYIWAMRAVGRPVYGAIHNGALAKMNKTEAKKPKPLDERFTRVPTVRTDRELDEIARDAYETVRIAWGGYLAQGQDYRAGRTPNGDTCRFRCPYTQTCLTGRQQGWKIEQEVMAGQGFKKLAYTNLREVGDDDAASVEGD